MTMTLLIFVGPSFAKTHNEKYSVQCSVLWPAVKETLRNSGYYGILGIDNTEMTASFVIGGTLGGKRINSVVLNAKENACEMVVQTAFSGLVHDDYGDFKTRVNQSLFRLQHPQLSPPAKPEGASNKEKLETPVPASGGAPGTMATALPANSYEGDFPGLAYRAPQGWTTATAEKLHQGNEARLARVTAGVVQQHPGDTSLHVIAPKALFYASPLGGGDGDQISLPSVRIMALEWSGEPPSLDTVEHDAEEKVKLGVTLLHPPTEYKVAGQVFIRAEYKDERQKPQQWECHVQTVAKGYLLTLEIYAGSEEELLQAGSTVDSFSVSAP